MREKFVRLQQIATLLNLDQVRVFLFYVRESGVSPDDGAPLAS